jgi:hypothetical protein
VKTKSPFIDWVWFCLRAPILLLLGIGAIPLFILEWALDDDVLFSNWFSLWDKP